MTQPASFEARIESALALQSEQHAAAMEKMDEMSLTLNQVRDDVVVIKAKDYDSRINRLNDKVSNTAEKLAGVEVRSGFLSIAVAAIVAFFTGRPYG